ncbi:hypothetical protein L7F22_061813 [Adiantum nelumboides]|nr:hypothetical protein [Adiantum nelumboides]
MMQNVRDVYRRLSSLSFSFMSVILGPLYPMISLAIDAGQLDFCIFRVKLLATCLLHVLLGTLPSYVSRACLSCCLSLIFSVAIDGYLGFLIAYLLLDACCGPERVDLRGEGDGSDDGGDHPLKL